MRGREKYPNFIFIFSQFHNEVLRLHLFKENPAEVCVEKVAWHVLPGSLTEALVLTTSGLV